ncbi:MAG: muramoyltetrapeptide carboxypeptidase [Blastocatellia bacterium]|jgi:muramoyltetrapeptide carboxypeptidase|nr:muramoyltetrapeptide carboxypeptidase [Blastocatellia bacterium]
MRRRRFLHTFGAGLALPLIARVPVRATALADGLIRPKALKAGDTVGLITPATYVPDPDRIAMAERTIKFFGLRMKIGKNAGKRMGDYRISIEERLDDLHSMFRDKDVDAVFAIRGGYGSMHILDRIDYDLIQRNPKIFLGYSDITAMHLAINKHAKLVTFHGPIALSRFTDYTQKYFRKALFDNQPIGALTNPPESNELRPSHPLRTIRPGIATGPLIGGNLTLISNTMGTPYEIETRGRVLFLEDVDEEPYSIDRMLTHLRLAGTFEGVAGVIFGECQDCKPKDYKPSFTIPYSLGEVLDNILGNLKVPVLSGLTIGHTDDQLTLPLGVAATLDSTKGTLAINEAGVR